MLGTGSGLLPFPRAWARSSASGPERCSLGILLLPNLPVKEKDCAVPAIASSFWQILCAFGALSGKASAELTTEGTESTEPHSCDQSEFNGFGGRRSEFRFVTRALAALH